MNSIQLRKLITGALMLTIGIVLPQLFHMVGGPTTGGIFLPMHLPVLIGGLLLGPFYGCALGFVLPILSFLVTGMPHMSRLLLMMFELTAYGLTSGLLYKQLKLPLYPSLLLAQIGGRLACAVGILVTGAVFTINMPIFATVASAVVTGLPGIVLQYVLIGPVMFALKKGEFVHGIPQYRKSNR